MAEVAKCPRCERSIDETHDSYGCPKCGHPLPEDIRRSLPKLPPLAASVAHTQSGSPVVSRYRDAYGVGAALVGVGGGIKVIGGILAGIIFLGSLLAGDSRFGVGAAFAGILLAGIVGFFFWVFGVFVAAQGQVLQATLDQAVASSPFLTDAERADAMGLPPTVADHSIG